MISQTNSSSIRTAYANSFNETKAAKSSTGTTVSKQGDTSKVDQLKESIGSGSYKVDLEALSNKIAQELV
jgi:anti-sigma28 factor (negative regulator of flagellin synthesis)